MNKKLLSLILLCSLALPTIAMGDAAPKIIDNVDELINLIKSLTDILFTALIVMSSAFIVWAGFEFVTSGGSDEKVGSAKKKMTYALIGLVVAIAARGLVAVVRSILK